MLGENIKSGWQFSREAVMKKSSEILLTDHQIRKTKIQKQRFREWLTEYLSESGYTFTEDWYSQRGCNFIAGDVRTAETVISAHYDTPPNFIFPAVIGFSSWFSFLISQFLMILPFAAVIMLYIFLVSFLSLSGYFLLAVPAVSFAYSLQIMFGAANRHNANDNTSGTAVLISVLEQLPAEERHKVCVVFFDQEESGLIGSKHFYKKYKKYMDDKPLINFDCVTDGRTLNFISKKKFRNSVYCALLREAAEKSAENTDRKIRFADALSNVYMSDQMSFPVSSGVAAAKKIPVFGYYIDRIHSRFDTKFDSENISVLTQTAVRLISALPCSSPAQKK